MVRGRTIKNSTEQFCYRTGHQVQNEGRSVGFLKMRIKCDFLRTHLNVPFPFTVPPTIAIFFKSIAMNYFSFSTNFLSNDKPYSSYKLSYPRPRLCWLVHYKTHHISQLNHFSKVAFSKLIQKYKDRQILMRSQPCCFDIVVVLVMVSNFCQAYLPLQLIWEMRWLDG